MNTDRDVTATFTTGATVSVEITGRGSVTSSDDAIDCAGPNLGTPCEHRYYTSSQITLTPTADYGSTFVGWSGDCTGTGSCIVDTSASRSVVAAFEDDQLLIVEFAGDGAGTVEIEGIDPGCTSQCLLYLPYGSEIDLTATDGPGFFTSWSGDCSGSNAQCTVTMDGAQTVSASFDAGDSFSVLYWGEGDVETSNGFIDCGSGNCNGAIPTGESTTLTARPAPGYTFGGWGSACSGFGGCVVDASS
jgi:hypothetical protein